MLPTFLPILVRGGCVLRYPALTLPKAGERLRRGRSSVGSFAGAKRPLMRGKEGRVRTTSSMSKSTAAMSLVSLTARLAPPGRPLGTLFGGSSAATELLSELTEAGDWGSSTAIWGFFMRSGAMPAGGVPVDVGVEAAVVGEPPAPAGGRAPPARVSSRP